MPLNYLDVLLCESHGIRITSFGERAECVIILRCSITPTIAHHSLVIFIRWYLGEADGKPYHSCIPRQFSHSHYSPVMDINMKMMAR